MKIGLVIPEHGRASQNGRSFRPSLHRRQLQSPETGSCGDLQVKVAASNSAFTDGLKSIVGQVKRHSMTFQVEAALK